MRALLSPEVLQAGAVKVSSNCPKYEFVTRRISGHFPY